MSKEWNFRACKGALIRPDNEAMLLEVLEDLAGELQFGKFLPCYTAF